MNSLATEPNLDIASLILAALISFAYAAYLSTWVSRRIMPRVPLTTWWKAGAASAVITTGLNLAVGEPSLYVLVAAFVPPLLLSLIVDARTLRIPNAYVVHGLFLSVLAGIYFFVGFAGGPAWTAAVAWSAVMTAGVFVLFLLMNIFLGGSLGMGDVKMAPILAFSALLIQIKTWSPEMLASPVAISMLMIVALLWLMGTFLSASIWVLVRRMKKKQAFPFGPFMVLSWLAVVACTGPVSSWIARM